MIDDFFDDFFDDKGTNASVKSVPENEILKKTNAKELSDIVNQTRKLALQVENKNSSSDKETTYSESFEEVDKDSESREKTTDSKSASSKTETSSENERTRTPDSTASHSKSQISAQTSSQRDSSVSPEELDSQKTGTYSIEEGELKDIAREKSEGSDRSLSDDETLPSSRSQDISVSTVTERPPRGLSRLKLRSQNEVTKWLQKKRKEEIQRRRERKRAEELKLEEEEKKTREKQKLKRRARAAYREWREMKDQEEEESKRRQQEEEEEWAKAQQRRLATSSQAYVSWLNSHPRFSRRYDSRAYSGGRVVTYYDRGRPSSPTMVNPVPWRRL
ncbi:hypothetical protein C7M84_025173 [Penaeus vannamei]|uniref:Coiled-coil domain-containing protein n=1 Tax=Penaeus vannamei TaxID=6689 RepID=A0A3R7SYK5_PENVA|nr:hypothetical protein C7M84_025173 [Penaeus vannamei]